MSVITACYNASQTLQHTIDSLNDQGQRFEHIVVDGNSSDGTLQVLRSNEKRITSWISEPDQGMYDAMNKGAQMASGDWLAFLNADDRYPKGVIDSVLNEASRVDSDIIYGDLIKRRPLDDEVFERVEKPDLRGMKAGMSIFHPATFIKRDLFNDLMGYNTQYKLAADYDLFLRAYLASASFHYLPRPLAVFYVGGLSNTGCGTYSEAATIQEIYNTGYSTNTWKLFRKCQRKRQLRRIVFSLSRLPGGKSLLRAFIGKRWQ